MNSSLGEQKSSDDKPVPVRQIASEELFQGQNRLVIVHQGVLYRLMITRNGKLMLQK